MACVSHVPMGPFDLWDPMASGTFLYLHLTYGTRRLVCHLLAPGFNIFKLKKTMTPGSQTRDPDQEIDHLHHCTRHLIVLTCLWSPNSSICSLCG
jgi:hypothetical protein